MVIMGIIPQSLILVKSCQGNPCEGFEATFKLKSLSRTEGYSIDRSMGNLRKGQGKIGS